MTAVAPRRVAGPVPLAAVPLAELNGLFSDAFSERYRRDGMVGVRVPPLHPRIWAFAFEAAGDGAMAWRSTLRLTSRAWLLKWPRWRAPIVASPR